MDTTTKEKEIAEFIKANGLSNNPIVEIQKYHFRDFRDFFDKKEDLFDEMKENFEDVEFYHQEYLRYNLENIEITETLFNELKEYFESEGVDEYYEDKIKIGDTLEKLDEVDLDKLVEKFLNDELDEDLAQSLFDYNNRDEFEESNGFEDLAYWTIYWTPEVEDVEVAFKCGLVPFRYNGDFYLALGGCGMDLSPKLESYMALLWGQIPKDSQLFRQKDYFQYVVGSETTKEVLKEITLDKPIVKISYSLDEDLSED